MRLPINHWETRRYCTRNNHSTSCGLSRYAIRRHSQPPLNLTPLSVGATVIAVGAPNGMLSLAITELGSPDRDRSRAQ
jgi:hypothetical protein